MRNLLTAVFILASFSAMAQKEAFKPAPVPDRSFGDVPPADRAGRSDAADNSAPFAAAPTDQNAGRGQETPQNAPSTERATAPTPSLSR